MNLLFMVFKYDISQIFGSCIFGVKEVKMILLFETVGNRRVIEFRAEIIIQFFTDDYTV